MEYFKFGNGEKKLVILPGLSVQSVMGLKDLVEQGYSVLTDASSADMREWIEKMM